MALKLLHLGIFFMFVAVEITCIDVPPTKIHVINALTDPSPIHLSFSIAKDEYYARNEILKQGEKLDLELNTGADFFCNFRRGEGAQSISKALYLSYRDASNPKFLGDIYWKVEDDGVSLSYDNNSYGENGGELLIPGCNVGVRDVFELAHQLDPLPIPFLNVIEGCSLQRIEQLRNAGYDGPLGIGLQGHFDLVEPNFPYIRASIDMLHAAALPIWITEFDVARNALDGFQVCAVSYDYSYVLECVPKPEAPLYNGGIVSNPEFNEELKGWKATGEAKIESPKSPEDGNRYAVVTNTLTLQKDGIYQSLNVEKGKLYAVSAWFQLSEGHGAVHVKLVKSNGEQTANYTFPKAGCWTMLKGGFDSNDTESAKLQIEANVTGTVMWVDSVSVQQFTQEEWNSHQVESVDKLQQL
ncbi:endo-1,4-beta-xylanase [Salvia divinorum]|uniref:Endo-1,4-beta-xylanase n=1 Tax=Salvia divinorum TaxID=28513 RepID=A0ABD1H7I5_SALDI